jgi:hypothetical protein
VKLPRVSLLTEIGSNMKINAESIEKGSSLLDELEQRHDDVIRQIDELAVRIEETLAKFKPPTVATVGPQK